MASQPLPPTPARDHPAGEVPSRSRSEPAALFERARRGNKRALGRLISILERGGTPAREVARLVFPLSAGVETVVGITGAPGSGKSTLVDRMITEARKDGAAVGVLAVDPSSPLSGGSILGDRVRMQSHAGDPGVFIRSMATRGHLGGLALAAPEVVRLLAATGFDTVIVETVGVGQVEIEVAGAADTTVVVLTPGWGDAVQASKAGLLEVADVFVVNKADRPGANETARDLQRMLDLDTPGGQWRPPVLLTTAFRGEGVEEMWKAVSSHGSYLRSSGELQRRRHRRLTDEVVAITLRLLERDIASVAGEAAFDQACRAVLAGELDPFAAASALAESARR